MILIIRSSVAVSQLDRHNTLLTCTVVSPSIMCVIPCAFHMVTENLSRSDMPFPPLTVQLTQTF